LLPTLAAAGRRHVLVAPVQFLADHLEVLYDLDVAAREQAERYGLTFLRTPSLNTTPLFIEALADVVEAELTGPPAAPPRPQPPGALATAVRVDLPRPEPPGAVAAAGPRRDRPVGAEP